MMVMMMMMEIMMIMTMMMMMMIALFHSQLLQVNEAKKRLNAINKETIAAIRTKQAAALILTKEAEMVKYMMEEGLLTHTDAEDILEQITVDMKLIEKKRNLIFK